jgi:uncharacterized repeat protein (TIGR03803 family)
MIQIRNCATTCIALGAFAAIALLHATAAEAATETVVYSFCGQQLCTDGAYPYAPPTGAEGTLYGTTPSGGLYPNDYGTVYSLDPETGAEIVLYTFSGGADGAFPYAGLIDMKGKLYGVTANGGSNNNCYLGCGTLFAIDLKTGAEKVLHSFGSGTDGVEPSGNLINVDGVLYGATPLGGASGEGSVFSLDSRTGTERVLHSFSNGTDGAYPYGGLIDEKGMLYGTTSIGGAYDDGTVFAIDPKTGTETVLYSFGKGVDGMAPVAGLIDIKGTLYGTTALGGSFRGGTVFALDPKTGAEILLHSFAVNGKDGAEPEAPLVNVNGKLYGTTYEGGTTFNGAVFSLDPKSGKETMLYSFCSAQYCTDGQYPSGLSNVSGMLYGTTYYGGAHNGGAVFAITP